MIKKILNYKFHIIGAFSILVILFISFFFISSYVNVVDVDTTVIDDHDYVVTTVVDKRYEEGYGSLWWYQAPKYYIISQDDKSTWVTTVDQATYDMTTNGTTLVICTIHNKLKEYEQVENKKTSVVGRLYYLTKEKRTLKESDKISFLREGIRRDILLLFFLIIVQHKRHYLSI